MTPEVIVAAGYDQIAEAYLAWSGESRTREPCLERMALLLQPGARVLDLGCGAGVPVAKWLSGHGFDLTGIDISRRQIGLARTNVPSASFSCGNIAELDLTPGSFDAITSFYAITPIPRIKHDAVFAAIHCGLWPGGLFAGNLGVHESDDWSGEWLGTEMFFSHYSGDTSLRLMRDAGFEIIERSIRSEGESDHDTEFLWVIARALA